VRPDRAGGWPGVIAVTGTHTSVIIHAEAGEARGADAGDGEDYPAEGNGLDDHTGIVRKTALPIAVTDQGQRFGSTPSTEK